MSKSSSKEWFYVGESGEIEGPFSRKKMRHWYDKGYLPHTLRVRRGEDGAFTVLKAIKDPFRKSDEIPEVKKNRAVAKKDRAPKIPELEWFYYDESKRVQGPFSSSHMRKWRQKGYLSNDLIVKCGKKGNWRPIKSLGKRPFDQHPKKKSKITGFFYIDEKQEERGPFKFSHMAHWAKNGYLPENLLLRVNEGPFVRFKSLKASFCNSDAQGAKRLYAIAARSINSLDHEDRDLAIANKRLEAQRKELDRAENDARIQEDKQKRLEMKRAARAKEEEELAKREKAQKAKAEIEAREKAAEKKLQRMEEEAKRVLREKAERDRIAREKKAEEERIAREKKAEEERVALAKGEQAERDRIARLKKAEEERIAREKKEEEERDRIAREKKAEEERVALAKREQAERDRIARLKKAEEERIAREKKEEEERDRIAREKKAEEERVALAKREQAERDRIARLKKAEEERIALAEREQAERERIARLRKAEEERIAREKKEQEERERIAREKKAEEERVAREKKEQEERERIAREKKAEEERAAREKKEKEERERIAREKKAEEERVAREKKEQEERERIAREKKAEEERVAREKKEKEERERIAREKKAEEERVAREKKEQEERERIAREKKAEEERVAREKKKAEDEKKAEAEKAASVASKKKKTDPQKKKDKTSSKGSSLAKKRGLDLSKIKFGPRPVKRGAKKADDGKLVSRTKVDSVDEKDALLSRPTISRKHRRRRPKTRSFGSGNVSPFLPSPSPETPKSTKAPAPKTADASNGVVDSSAVVSSEKTSEILTEKSTASVSTSSIKKKYFGDPWNQLSSWNDSDEKCDEFVPDQFKSYKCKACGRVIDKHRRDTVKKANQVLNAIDARGGESRILDADVPKGCKGELWLGGQKGITSDFFKENNIKLCVTAAHGLNKRFRGFNKRRKAACDASGAAILSLNWEDSETQKIEWEELRDAIGRIHATRLSGGSVVIHCAAGQSRSATVTIAYLLAFAKKRNEGKALDFCISKRPMVRPNNGFRKQLRDFHKKGLFKGL